MKHFKVPNHVFNLNLTPIEFCVLCCLLKCRNSVTGKCFPSYSKIANECHIARSSVAKAVKSLQEKQILKVQHILCQNKFDNKPITLPTTLAIILHLIYNVPTKGDRKSVV